MEEFHDPSDFEDVRARLTAVALDKNSVLHAKNEVYSDTAKVVEQKINSIIEASNDKIEKIHGDKKWRPEVVKATAVQNDEQPQSTTQQARAA